MPFILAAAAAAASSARTNAAAALQTLDIGGVCAEMVVAGATAPQGCRGHVTYTLLDDGRTTFRFESPGGPSLSFHGNGLAETKAGGGMTALPVDGVTEARTGQARTLPATGQCLYGDPFRGRTAIRCTASAEAAAYRGTFVTDGQPPGRQPVQPSQAHTSQARTSPAPAFATPAVPGQAAPAQAAPAPASAAPVRPVPAQPTPAPWRKPG